MLHKNQKKVTCHHYLYQIFWSSCKHHLYEQKHSFLPKKLKSIEKKPIPNISHQSFKTHLNDWNLLTQPISSFILLVLFHKVSFHKKVKQDILHHKVLRNPFFILVHLILELMKNIHMILSEYLSFMLMEVLLDMDYWEYHHLYILKSIKFTNYFYFIVKHEVMISFSNFNNFYLKIYHY